MHPAEMDFAEYQVLSIPRELEATERRMGILLAVPQAELCRAQQRTPNTPRVLAT